MIVGFSRFVLRSALLPLRQTEQLSDHELGCLLKAISLSAPDVFDQFSGGGISRDNIDHILSKYIRRARYNCSPFGWFSGSQVGKIVESESNVLLQENPFFLSTAFLDFGALSAIVVFLESQEWLMQYMQYFQNPTCYVCGDKFRFWDYSFSVSGVIELNSIKTHPVIAEIFNQAGKGVCFPPYTDGFTQTGSAFRTALSKVVKLKVILSELNLAFTDLYPLNFLIGCLERVSKVAKESESSVIEGFISALRRVQAILETVNLSSEHPVSYWNNLIAEQLLSFGIGPKRKSVLFAVNSHVNVSACQLKKGILDNLCNEIQELSRIGVFDQNKALTKFRDSFCSRYDTREVPLSEALDLEVGIGYKSAKFNPDLFFGPQKWKNQQKAVWIKSVDQTIELFWFNLLANHPDRSKHLEIRRSDIAHLPSQVGKFCDTFSVITSFVSDNGNDELVRVKSIGGSSGVNLLTRLCRGNIGMSDLVAEICDKENELNSSAILMEVISIDSVELGNVSVRQSFRGYEFCYIGSVDGNTGSREVIPAADIMIRVTDDRILLRSKKYNKQIIPRISTAVSSTFYCTDLVQLLYDLQLEATGEYLSIDNWVLNNWHYVPRIVYNKKYIIRPATWKLDSGLLLNSETKKDNIRLKQAILQHLSQENIPVCFTVKTANGDIMLRATSEVDMDYLVKLIKKKRINHLQEYLPPSALLSSNGYRYSNEVIFTLFRETSRLKPVVFDQNAVESNSESEPSILPGQGWVSLHIFIGYTRIEEVLLEIFEKVIGCQSIAEYFELWYFLRFYEPSSHLRIRFKIVSGRQDLVIPELLKVVSDICVRRSTRYSMEPYFREVGRLYCIEIAEKLFAIESKFITKLFLESASARTRWYIAFWICNDWFNSFNYDHWSRLCFLRNAVRSFDLASKLHTSTRTAFNKHVKTGRKFYDMMVNGSTDINILNTFLTEKIIETFSQRRREIDLVLSACDQGAFEKLKKNIPDYMHLSVNRIFSHNHLIYEKLLIQTLHGSYEALWSRKNGE